MAACDIEKGAILCTDNLAIKRPGDGMSPYAYWQLLGQPAKRAYQAGEPIRE
ncbi:N,N'-diacetyllegionaminic acid synthase [compost metagenome]